MIGRQPSLLKNLLAGSTAQAWHALLQLLAVPVLVLTLGVETYGLLGLLLTMQGIVRLLDLGLVTTLVRHFATLRAAAQADEEHSFHRTFEVTYVALAVLVALALAALVGPLAERWIDPTGLDEAELRLGLSLLAPLCGVQFLNGFYTASLMGRERQVLCSALRLAETTTTWAGGAAALVWLSPRPATFLTVQLAAALIYLVTARAAALRGLAAPGARFDARHYGRVGRFAAYLAAISMCTLVLTQLDKVLLSRFVPLGEFAAYALAFQVANGVTGVLVSPVLGASLPRFAVLAASERRSELAAAFTISTQLMSGLLVSACLTLVLFSGPLLTLWLRDEALAARVKPVLSLVLAGTVLSGLMNVPYALQLALGRTDVALACNVAAALTAAVGYGFGVPGFGLRGAAIAWCLAMVCYAVVSTILSRPLLPYGTGIWWTRDVLAPTVASAAMVGVIASVLGDLAGVGAAGAAALAGAAGLAGAILASGQLRRAAAARLRSFGTPT